MGASVNDHAANESKRVAFISKIKARIAAELGATHTEIMSFFCNTHKAMLLAKALRKADHDYLSTLCPDRDVGEFRTNNLIDMFCLQLAKMFDSPSCIVALIVPCTHVVSCFTLRFGHHSDAYAFGHGVDTFPAWMQDKYPDRWRGFKRLVGNRANIFLENSVTMYYMATYYREYTNFVLREAKAGNGLHKRLDEKLRSAEMLAGELH